MDSVGFVLSICAFIIAGFVCIPGSGAKFAPNKFDDFNCTEVLNCTDLYDPVCGSDGVTYDSMCHLTEEYQRHVCEVGDFNPIAFVSKGNCTKTFYDTFIINNNLGDDMENNAP